MRSFVGLPLPDAVVDALERVQAELDVGRSVPGENLHLTLAFLGNQPEHVLMALHEELKLLFWPAPELRITGLDIFGGKKPRILFATVETNPVLAGLREKVRTSARAAGIALSRERFRPHVTLARFDQRGSQGDARKLQRFLTREGALTLPPFSVDRLALYCSTLTPAGSVYEVLEEYPLGFVS